MTCCTPAPTAVRRPRPARSASATTGITVYSCGADEAALFRERAQQLGVRLILTDAALSEANVDLARGHGVVSVGHKAGITAPTLVALSRAGVDHLSTRSVGSDHVDLEKAAELGITVGTVAYSPDSVADYTLMLTLMLLRDATSVLRRVDAHDYRLSGTPGTELRDLTVGVVGTGRIGTAVMTRLRGFGCRVLAHDRRPTTADHVPLDELVARSDVVTLHTPLDAGTRHLLSRERIDALKPGAFVVNTGRGALLDTEALLAALENGRLGGAALDVVEGEEGAFYSDCAGRPIHGHLSRLHALPNVIVSPHTAYYTGHALRDIVESTLAECLSRGGDQHA
jgi:D-specific alpha-keto acid dehydrogenase